MPRQPLHNPDILPDWAQPAPGLTLLLGLPGAGKTTLLRHLWSIGLNQAGARMLPEHFAFPLGWTVEEVLCRAGHDNWPNDLPTAEIAWHQRADRVSRGQRQLLGLASLGIGTTRAWLIDEPLLGLDGQQGQAVVDWLHQQSRQRRMLIATHDWAPFLQREAHAIVLIAGSVRHSGPLDALVAAAEAHLEIRPRHGGPITTGVDVPRVLAWVSQEGSV